MGRKRNAGSKSPPPPTTNAAPKRRVMVVADPTRESAGALQYTLTRAMQDNDDLVLIHVTNGNPRRPMIKSFFKRHSDPGIDAKAALAAAVEGTIDGLGDGRGADFLEVMKRACEATHPKSRVWIEKVDQGSMEKGVAILGKAKLMAIDLLVVGQRRHFSSVLLGSRRSASAGRAVARAVDTADFLIENSPCTCVAVQKRGQNAGYLLNSKTHRNFWLLA